MSNGDQNKKKKTVKVGDWSVSGNERSRIIETRIEGGIKMAEWTTEQREWYNTAMGKIKDDCPNCTDDEIEEIYRKTYQTKTEIETQKMGYQSIGADETMYPGTFRSMLSLFSKTKDPADRHQIGGAAFLKDPNNPAFFHLNKESNTKIHSFEDYAHHMRDAWNTQYGVPDSKGKVDGKTVYSSARPAVFKGGKLVKGIVIAGKSYSLDSDALHKGHSVERVLETKMTNATKQYIIDKYGEDGEISRYQFWQAKAATSKSGTYHGYKFKETVQYPLEWRQEMRDKFSGQVAGMIASNYKDINVNEAYKMIQKYLRGKELEHKEKYVLRGMFNKSKLFKNWIGEAERFLGGSSLSDKTIRKGSTTQTGYGASTFTSGS